MEPGELQLTPELYEDPAERSCSWCPRGKVRSMVVRPSIWSYDPDRQEQVQERAPTWANACAVHLELLDGLGRELSDLPDRAL